MEDEERDAVQGLHHELGAVGSGQIDSSQLGSYAEFRLEKRFEGFHGGFQLLVQWATTTRIKSSGAAVRQAAERVGLLDLVDQLFHLIDETTAFEDGFKSSGFRCFFVCQSEELLAVELPAAIRSVRIDLALSLIVG